MYTHPGGIISQSITRPPADHFHPPTDQRGAFQSHGFTNRYLVCYYSIQSILVRLLRNLTNYMGVPTVCQSYWEARPMTPQGCCCHVDTFYSGLMAKFLIFVLEGSNLMSDTQAGCGQRAINCWPNNESSNVYLLWLLCTYLQIMPQGYPHCGDIYKSERFLMAPCECLRETARPT